MVKEVILRVGTADAVKNVGELRENIKQLKKEFKNAAVLDMFKLSKNYKTTLDEYYRDFRDIITNNTTSFMKCVELTKKFDEMYNSPEMLTFRNTL